MPLPHGSKPAPPDRRPYRRMSEPGEEITFETADPTGRRWRKVWRQVGWLGQSGAFYTLGEPATAHEPGSVAPLYSPAHVDEIGPDPDLTAAYRERARLVAHLASLFPSVLAYADPDAPDWAVVYISSPTGQLSWHIAPADVELFAHVPKVTPDDQRAEWDGHDTATKYDRLTELTARTHYERRAGQARA